MEDFTAADLGRAGRGRFRVRRRSVLSVALTGLLGTAAFATVHAHAAYIHAPQQQIRMWATIHASQPPSSVDRPLTGVRGGGCEGVTTGVNPSGAAASCISARGGWVIPEARLKLTSDANVGWSTCMLTVDLHDDTTREVVTSHVDYFCLTQAMLNQAIHDLGANVPCSRGHAYHTSVSWGARWAGPGPIPSISWFVAPNLSSPIINSPEQYC